MPEPHHERAAAFLERLARWVDERDDVRALVLVGSHARGEARADSDVDVVMLCTDARTYLEDTRWVSGFGVATRTKLEAYGVVTSVRVLYENGLEVELAIAPPDWASEPLDPGTLQVAKGGLRVLLDRDGHATQLAARI